MRRESPTLPTLPTLPSLLSLALALCAGAPARAADGDAPPVPAEAESAEARRLGKADLARLEKELAAHPDSLPLRLDRVRLLYVLAVKEEDLMDRGAREASGLAARGTDPVLVQAYRGAFRVLGAKHAGWPPRKLDHLKAGLLALDSAVAARPDHAEVRYLRLVSSYYLPFFIGRKDSVRTDFAALGRLLPASHREFPARWWLGFARFVLAKGRLGEPERKALEARVQEVSARAEAARGGRGAATGGAPSEDRLPGRAAAAGDAGGAAP